MVKLNNCSESSTVSEFKVFYIFFHYREMCRKSWAVVIICTLQMLYIWIVLKVAGVSLSIFNLCDQQSECCLTVHFTLSPNQISYGDLTAVMRAVKHISGLRLSSFPHVVWCHLSSSRKPFALLIFLSLYRLGLWFWTILLRVIWVMSSCYENLMLCETYSSTHYGSMLYLSFPACLSLWNMEKEKQGGWARVGWGVKVWGWWPSFAP